MTSDDMDRRPRADGDPPLGPQTDQTGGQAAPNLDLDGEVDTALADRTARRARRRARRLLREAQAVETPPSQGLSAEEIGDSDADDKSPKRRRDVLKVMKQEERKQGGNNLPATRDTGTEIDHPAPSQEDLDAEREAEIAQIQRELVQRRRRRFLLLFLRLAFFVILPTFLVGNFYYNHASSFYSAKAVVMVRFGETATTLGEAGGLNATPFATTVESISVQEFLVSREGMRLMDEDLGIIEHYADPSIDPIQRLPEGASENTAYSLYKDRILIGYDTTEGIIRMEVIDSDPEMAFAIIRWLMRQAEARVDTMSDRNRTDAFDAAQAAYDEAESQWMAARGRVLDLQERLNTFDTDLEIQSVLTEVGRLRAERSEISLALRELQRRESPNQTQVRSFEARIELLDELIAEERARVVDPDATGPTLARQAAELEQAELEAAVRLSIFEQAAANREVARQGISQQRLYLNSAVNPVQPDVPSYPRAFEYTALAFIIFFAIYMMASLSISILREQMSYGNNV